MIHNGFFRTAGNTVFLALPPGSLAVATIEFSYVGVAVPYVGFFLLTETGNSAAIVATVALPTITTAAYIEDCTAFQKPANTFNQYNFGASAHIPPEGGTGQSPRFVSALNPIMGGFSAYAGICLRASDVPPPGALIPYTFQTNNYTIFDFRSGLLT